jgi:hypothetical protein
MIVLVGIGLLFGVAAGIGLLTLVDGELPPIVINAQSWLLTKGWTDVL